MTRRRRSIIFVFRSCSRTWHPLCNFLPKAIRNRCRWASACWYGYPESWIAPFRLFIFISCKDCCRCWSEECVSNHLRSCLPLVLVFPILFPVWGYWSTEWGCPWEKHRNRAYVSLRRVLGHWGSFPWRLCAQCGPTNQNNYSPLWEFGWSMALKWPIRSQAGEDSGQFCCYYC